MVKAFEGGRGLAAMLVALFHFRLLNGVSVLGYGYVFVDLFFVLSGFLISSIYWGRLGERGTLRIFLLRRFGRLFQLLIVSTVLFVILQNGLIFLKNQLAGQGWPSFAGGVAQLGYKIPTTGEVLATVTMTHGLGMFDRLILNVVSWSISVEFYSYLVFAGLCLLLRPERRGLMCALLALAAYALTLWASLGPGQCLRTARCLDVTYDFGLARCLAAFLLGALCWRAACALKWRAGLWQSAGVAGLALVFSLLDTYPGLAFLCPALFAVLVLAISKDEGWLARGLQYRFFQLLGERSYSIYMMHVLVLMPIEPLLKRLHGPVLIGAGALLYCVLLIVIAGYTYTWIEQPGRAWFNQLAANTAAGWGTGVKRS